MKTARQLRDEIRLVLSGLRQDLNTARNAAEHMEKGTMGCATLNGFAGGLEHAVEALEPLLRHVPETPGEGAERKNLEPAVRNPTREEMEAKARP
jgi:hypothetical protein